LVEKLQWKKNTSLGRTVSVFDVIFSFLPFFPSQKCTWCSTFTHDESESKINMYTKLVVPEEGNEKYDMKRVYKEEFLDQKGKKKKLRVNHGIGLQLVSAKKIDEKTSIFSHLFGKQNLT
jgi:hypothetical protein